MSFRKRSVPLPSNIAGATPSTRTEPSEATFKVKSQPGVRPSAQFPYLLTTSTGTTSLDDLLGLGAGLALGSILSIEEYGSTDYAGVLLSCFASQGILHGQEVFVAAPRGSWPSRGTLPGLSKESRSKKLETNDEKPVGDRMKIAWRYERLGMVGLESQKNSSIDQSPFCHSLDLTTSLLNPKITYLVPMTDNPFPDLAPLVSHLTANPHLISRLVLPSVLSPLYYLPVTDTTVAGRFFAQLRLLVHKFPSLVVAMSWPLSLFPKNHALTIIMERLVHGIISLEVFPHSFSIPDDQVPQDEQSEKADEKMDMQGMIRVKSLPVLSDRGMGIKATDGDWAFAMGRRRMIVRPFNLPPLGDLETGSENKKRTSESLDF